MSELQPGSAIGGFIVKSRLGKGGMGEVYLVHDAALRVDRALKRIALSGPGFTGRAAETKEYRDRFLREARTLARLQHPRIIPVHEVGETEGGDPYLVMTHFPSRDARKWLRDAQPDLKRIRKVGVQVADALAYAHEQGVLHRDIKLANFLVDDDDDVMLIDFGLAKASTDEKLTRAGKSMGTYSYLAPEYVIASLNGHQEHTALTDIWALGCSLYALTCRKPAFYDRDDLKLLGLIKDARFAPVKTLRPDVDDEWARLIHALMEPDPKLRIQSAREAQRRLEGISFSPLAPKAPPPAAPALAPAPVVLAVDAADIVAEAAKEVGASLGRAVQQQAKPIVDDRELAAVGSASGTGTSASAESLFDHDLDAREETPLTAPQTTLLAQPSFDLPPEQPNSARKNAKRALLLPLAAALCVGCIGGGLVLLAGHAAASKHRSEGEEGYVDPIDLERRQRAKRELEDLDQERQRHPRPDEKHAESTSSLMPIVFTAPEPATAPTSTSNALDGMPAQPSTRAGPRRPITRTDVPATIAAAASDDPWVRRYGTRVSYNTSSAAPSSPSATVASTPDAPIAGVKIPVQVRDAIASAPVGPVIAIVEAPTKIGHLELPAGTEIHGRTTGTSGARVLVGFTFAIVNGKNVTLKGSALGTDGRGGVPGTKGMGGISDVAAGAAAGGAQVLVGLAAAATGNPLAAGVMSGAGSPIVNKTSRLDNEEQLVLTGANARFFVYVESVS